MALSAMRLRAATTNDPPGGILVNTQFNLAPAHSAQLPTPEAMTKQILRQRRKNEEVGPAMTLLDLEIGDIKTNSGHSFVWADSGQGDDRIIMFSTAENMKRLESSERQCIRRIGQERTA